MDQNISGSRSRLSPAQKDPDPDPHRSRHEYLVPARHTKQLDGENGPKIVSKIRQKTSSRVESRVRADFWADFRAVFLPAAEQAGQGVMHLFFFLNKFLNWGDNNHLFSVRTVGCFGRRTLAEGWPNLRPKALR